MQNRFPPGGGEPARQLLQSFLAEKRDRYYWQLSYPSAEATSGLSPYIKFGAISIRECVQTAQWQIDPAADRQAQLSRQQFVARLRWGSDRHPSEVVWAQAPQTALFPLPLDLDALDREQAQALRTWFVAHVEIKPHSSRARQKKAKTAKILSTDNDYGVQLDLL